MFSEIDIRTAAVFFAAKSEATGVVPLPVMLCPPGREDEGFRRFAIEFLTEVAQARYEGRKPPSINSYNLRKDEDYSVVN